MMRVGRIQYVNAYPVYGAIDRGVVPLAGTLVRGVPTALNRQMAEGTLDVSVVSAVEYARDAQRYLLLPDLGITSDGPVRSVMLYSRVPASELGGRRVLVSRSSLTSVELLRLLFEQVWRATPEFVPADAELADVSRFGADAHAARLVIGDAALLLEAARRGDRIGDTAPHYPHAYDLGAEWKHWTGLPFVFAVWVARRDVPVAEALGVQKPSRRPASMPPPATRTSPASSTTWAGNTSPASPSSSVASPLPAACRMAALPSCLRNRGPHYCNDSWSRFRRT